MSRAWWVALLPLLLIALLYRLDQDRGPFWLAVRQSPDYAYLLNALQLRLSGNAVAIGLHPGTTLTAYGAFGILAIEKLRKIADIRHAVLFEPEFFLRTLTASLALGFALCLFGCGLYVYRTLGKLRFALLFQLTPFLSSTILERLIRFCPESLMLSFLLVLGCWTLVLFSRRSERDSVTTLLILSTICGLGIATKVTFIPVLIFPLLLLQSLRAKALGVALSLTLAAVACLAVRWATIPQSFMKPPGWMHSVAFFQSLIWQPTIPVMLVACLAAFYFSRHARKPDRWNLRVWGALTVVWTSLLVGTAIRPGEPYLIPALGLSGLVLCLLYQRHRRIGLGIALPLLLFQIYHVADMSRTFAEEKQARIAIPRQVAQHATISTIIPCNFASLPTFALHKGDAQAGSPFAANLATMYPSQYFCDLNQGIFGTWTMKAELRQILANPEPVFLLGPPGESAQIASNLSRMVTEIPIASLESFYRLQ